MIRRHWITVVFIVTSIAGGLLAVSPAVGGTFLYPWGIAGLLAVAMLLFIFNLISWQRLKKKQHTRDPKRSVLYQGAAFTAWFSGLNLSWTLLSGICALGLLLAFGPRTWVLALIAGTLACAMFSLLGLLRIKRRQMMGLCWQSPVPFNLTDWLDRTAATMILPQRFEYAADHDQKQPTPVLWSISRIFDRGETGGTHRKLDLMDRNLPKKKMKMEWWQRTKIMALLFLATSILAALPGLLGLTSTPWDRVPDGWPSAKAREIAKEKKQLMADKQPPKQPPPDQPGQKKDPEKKTPTTSPDDKKDSKKDSKKEKNKENRSTETQQQDNQGSKGESDKTAPGDQKPAQEGQDGQKGDSGQEQGEAQKDAQTGEKAKEGEPGKEGESGKDGETGKEDKKGKEENGDGETQGDCDKPGGQGKPGKDGKPGEGDKNGEGQEQDKEGKDGGKPGQEGEGRKDGKGKEGESGKDGQQQESGGGKGAESGKKGGDSQTGGAQDGKKGTKGGGPGGEGQGKGSPDDVPKMDKDPQSQPIQKFPSRETEMVNLELPTLAPTGAKGESKKEEKKDEEKIKGAAAPASVFKSGTQDRRMKKPQQFLPNWILMLIKTTGSTKNTNTKER